jgi:hypothetical protein
MRRHARNDTRNNAKTAPRRATVPSDTMDTKHIVDYNRLRAQIAHETAEQLREWNTHLRQVADDARAKSRAALDRAAELAKPTKS